MSIGAISRFAGVSRLIEEDQRKRKATQMTETTIDAPAMTATAAVPATTWTTFASPLGTFTLAGARSTLQRIYFPSEAAAAVRELAERNHDRRLSPMPASQLEQYFAGERRVSNSRSNHTAASCSAACGTCCSESPTARRAHMERSQASSASQAARTSRPHGSSAQRSRARRSRSSSRVIAWSPPTERSGAIAAGSSSSARCSTSRQAGAARGARRELGARSAIAVVSASSSSHERTPYAADAYRPAEGQACRVPRRAARDRLRDARADRRRAGERPSRGRLRARAGESLPRPELPRPRALPEAILIQITFNEGRTVEQKQAFYAALVESLHERLGIRPQDVTINLVEVKKENWSFGNGVAQYVEQG